MHSYPLIVVRCPNALLVMCGQPVDAGLIHQVHHLPLSKDTKPRLKTPRAQSISYFEALPAAQLRVPGPDCSLREKRGYIGERARTEAQNQAADRQYHFS
jgi:hypothetical protein